MSDEMTLSFLSLGVESGPGSGNIGITISDKVAHGRARRVSITDHSRGRARGINNISKEPQQKGGLKGGLKSICSGNILKVNVLF